MHNPLNLLARPQPPGANAGTFPLEPLPGRAALQVLRPERERPALPRPDRIDRAARLVQKDTVVVALFLQAAAATGAEHVGPIELLERQGEEPCDALALLVADPHVAGEAAAAVRAAFLALEAQALLIPDAAQYKNLS